MSSSESIKRFYGWTERRLKGSIAETLIEQMLRYSGYFVYRFGYEMVLQHLKNVEIKEGYVKKIMQSMPDFIVVDGKGNAEIIEVKFRYNGKLDEIDMDILRNLGEYWENARIIIVSLTKPHFQISRVKEAIETGKLYPLEKDRFIKVNEDIIRRYEDLVVKHYTTHKEMNLR